MFWSREKCDKATMYRTYDENDCNGTIRNFPLQGLGSFLYLSLAFWEVFIMSDSGVVAVSFVTVHFNSITLFLPMYLPFCQLTPSRAAARSVSSSRCLDPWLHAGSQAEHTASTARVLRFTRGATVYALHRGRRVFTLKVLSRTFCHQWLCLRGIFSLPYLAPILHMAHSL